MIDLTFRWSPMWRQGWLTRASGSTVNRFAATQPVTTLRDEIDTAPAGAVRLAPNVVTSVPMRTVPVAFV